MQALVNAGIANTSPAIITSSADGSHNVGYGDIGEGGVTVRYTLLGDADLNGQVNFNDFLTLQNNFSQSGVFNQGDFTYDGVVNFNDFLALQNNFGQSVTGAPVTFTSAQVAAITAFAATVPEPASLAVLGLAGIGFNPSPPNGCLNGAPFEFFSPHRAQAVSCLGFSVCRCVVVGRGRIE